MDRKPFYTVSEAAEIAGVSRSTVYRRIHRGKIVAFGIRRECIDCVRSSKRLSCRGCRVT